MVQLENLQNDASLPLDENASLIMSTDAEDANRDSVRNAQSLAEIISPPTIPESVKKTLDKIDAYFDDTHSVLGVNPSVELDIYQDAISMNLRGGAGRIDDEKLFADFTQHEPEMRKRLEENPKIAYTSPTENKIFGFYTLNEFNAQVDGRLYINLKPENLSGSFEQLVSFLAEHNVACDIKIATNENQNLGAGYFGRSDKIVLYFDSQNTQNTATLLEQIRAFHEANAAQFDAAIPAFSAALKDNQGNAMDGISFGEQPDEAIVRHAIYESMDSHYLHKQYSFTSARVAMLLRRQFTRQFPDAYGDDKVELYIASCKKFGIDPYAPAFNANSTCEALKNEVIS